MLTIKSLKQEDGKWVASARAGPTEEKPEPSARDRHDGLQAYSAVDGRPGRGHSLTVLDDKNARRDRDLDHGPGGARGDRDRPVKLEKKD